MHRKVESGKSRSVNLKLCARRPLPTKCVADVPQAVSTGQLDRAVPAHALAGRRISWHGRLCRVPPGRGVSSYALRDDEAWKHMLSSKRPDVSSSNDFCDEENLAQPLVHAISRPDREGRPSVSSTPILDELQLRLHELEIDEIYARINPLLIGAFISTPILSTC